MSNRKIVIIGCAGLFILSSVYIFLTPEAFEARRNVKNIKNIRIGMDNKEVLQFMGEPDGKRLSFLNLTDSMYYYKPPFGASEGIYIQFDTNLVVNEIVDYE